MSSAFSSLWQQSPISSKNVVKYEVHAIYVRGETQQQSSSSVYFVVSFTWNPVGAIRERLKLLVVLHYTVARPVKLLQCIPCNRQIEKPRLVTVRGNVLLNQSQMGGVPVKWKRSSALWEQAVRGQYVCYSFLWLCRVLFKRHQAHILHTFAETYRLGQSLSSVRLRTSVRSSSCVVGNKHCCEGGLTVRASAGK